MGKYFRLLIVVLVVSSCTTSSDEVVYEEVLSHSIETDGRLPIDENGFYHLKLDPNRNQTIHRVSAFISNLYSPKKFEWSSNLYWWIREGDTITQITRSYFNEFTGEFVYTNLPPLVNWKDEIVPTINSASYSNEYGEINSVVAPIYTMKNDTLRISVESTELGIRGSINIVLE